MPKPIHKDERLTREAREIAARHGVKAYEPPVDTGKQEPGCECRVRLTAKALVDEAGPITCSVRRTHRDLVAALADPCSCEQLRSDAEVVRMAESFQERALKAELALIAARSLLEEAREVLQSFVHWSQPLPKLAGSQWASVTRVPYEGQMSQICHWLNETSKEASAVLAKIEAAGKSEIDGSSPVLPIRGRTVVLRKGGGSVTLSGMIDLFAIGTEERELIERVIALLDEYENRGAPAATIASTPDPNGRTICTADALAGVYPGAPEVKP